MKMRKISRKLALNKRTVVNFDVDSMINIKNIKGGETYTCITCDTCLSPPGGSHCLACMQPYETEGTCGMQTGAGCDPYN